jgi:hypothetical protein
MASNTPSSWPSSLEGAKPPYENLSLYPRIKNFLERIFSVQIPTDAYISGSFGECRKRIKNTCREQHWGTDVKWPDIDKRDKNGNLINNYDVFAPFAGKVKQLKRDKGWIMIQDQRGFFIAFAHLKKIPNYITVGYEINEGRYVGQVSNKGLKKDGKIHLHFEVGIDGTPRGMGVTLYNPNCWIPIFEEVESRSIINGSPSLQDTDLEAAISKLPSPLSEYPIETSVTASAADCGCYQPKLPELPTRPQPQMHRDPLILNLDGNGIRTVGLDAGIYFDHDCNGFKELTGWVAPGNGFLLVDTNGNASPDDGSELFGDFTILPNGMLAVNGFQALEQYDSNADGKIDAHDPIWSKLRILEYDRYDEVDHTDPHILDMISTLYEWGISAICLDSTLLNRTDSSIKGSSIKRPSVKGKITPMRGNREFPC